MNNAFWSLSKPTIRRTLWIAAVTTVFGVYSIAGFFLWFDAQMGTFRSLHALGNIAGKLEEQGRLPEAESVFREIVEIKQHQSVGPLFPGGLLPHEYYLETRDDLARVLMEQNRLLACRDEYARLIEDAARSLGTDDPYYAFLSSNYGECLIRSGRFEQARALLENAQPQLIESLGADHEWVQKNADRLKQVYGALKLN